MKIHHAERRRVHGAKGTVTSAMHREIRTEARWSNPPALRPVPAPVAGRPGVYPFRSSLPVTMPDAAPGPRVGYVIDRFPRGSHGFVLQEILALESHGVDVHVFSLGMPDGRLDDTAGALSRLRSPVCYFLADAEASGGVPEGTMFVPDYIAPDSTGSGMTSRAAHWIARQVTVRHLEHLHAHSAAMATDVVREAARLTGLGYSFTAHARDLRDAVGPTVCEKVLEARFAVTLSDYDHRRLVRLCGRGAADKLHCIPMSVDVEESAFTTPRSRDADSLLTVGPLVEKSGFADLVEAMRILRDRGIVARATIVGEGEYEDALRARIDRLGLAGQVQILASASRGELAVLMQTRTVLVLPWTADHGDRDVLSNLVLDAMAAGLPVLSTDGPSIRELIDDGLNGRVIASHDPVGLAGALETFLQSPRLRESMASNARTTVELVFGVQRNVAQLAKLFVGSAAADPMGA
jgi:colanic acid/amylovoran biosynthesis glycosyltransferase